MTMEQTLGFLIALALMLAGVLGSLVPGIPSTPFLLVGAIGHRAYFGDASLSNAALVVIVLLSLAALGLDYLATVIGARKMGATWRGILGATLGAVAGLIAPFPGLIIGPFVGALLFELAGGREGREAAQAGLGAVIGLFVGALGKVVVGIVAVAVFAIGVMGRTEARPPESATRPAAAQAAETGLPAPAQTGLSNPTK